MAAHLGYLRIEGIYLCGTRTGNTRAVPWREGSMEGERCYAPMRNDHVLSLMVVHIADDVSIVRKLVF